MPTSIKSLESILRKDFIDSWYTWLSIVDIWAWSWQKWLLLRDLTDMMYAVEVWKPYIDQYNIGSIYNSVLNENIMDIYKKIKWKVWIFGDILEHLSVKDAQEIIEHLKSHWYIIYVQIPYMYPQDEAFGNKYEIHLQPDLTEENFNERYPWFKLLARDTEVGLYKFTP